mmetsp:Transcript_44548/g.123380  ORF Transcript_44548/g.123380 Transcript_44548/m.123380 type:complete len:267 (-) Transcript_44548:296-1096(-)
MEHVLFVFTSRLGVHEFFPPHSFAFVHHAGVMDSREDPQATHVRPGHHGSAKSAVARSCRHQQLRRRTVPLQQGGQRRFILCLPVRRQILRIDLRANVVDDVQKVPGLDHVAVGFDTLPYEQKKVKKTLVVEVLYVRMLDVPAQRRETGVPWPRVRHRDEVSDQCQQEGEDLPAISRCRFIFPLLLFLVVHILDKQSHQNDKDIPFSECLLIVLQIFQLHESFLGDGLDARGQQREQLKHRDRNFRILAVSFEQRDEMLWQRSPFP